MEYLSLNIDDTLGGTNPSDFEVSSQKAIKTYIDDRFLYRFCAISGNATDGKSDLIDTNANVSAQATITTVDGIFGDDAPLADVTQYTTFTHTFSNPIQCSFINSFSESYIYFEMGFRENDYRIQPNIKIHYSDNNMDFFQGDSTKTQQSIYVGQLCGRYITSIEVEVYPINVETIEAGTCSIGKVQFYTQVASGTSVSVKSGDDYPAINLISGNGKEYSITESSENLDVSSLSNGDYYIMMTEDNNPYIISYHDAIGRWVQQPQDGIWVNTSEFPFSAQKENNGTWTETNDVPIGLFSIENGKIVWVKSLPFGNAWLSMGSDFYPLQVVDHWMDSNSGWGYKQYANNLYEFTGTTWVNTQWINTSNIAYINIWKPLYRPSMTLTCSVASDNGNTYLCVPQIHSAGGTEYLCDGAMVQLKGTSTADENWIPISFTITGYLYFRER